MIGSGPLRSSSPTRLWLVAGADGAGAVDPAVILAEPERAILATLRVAKRRHEWLLGRIAAKEVVRRFLLERAAIDLPADAIVIAAAPDGAPTVALQGARCHHGAERLELSISHRDGVAVAALSTAGPVGVDLELVEPRAAAFVEDFFTDGEQRRIRAAAPGTRELLVTALWSAKEAVLKAYRLGLRVDSRGFDCEIALDAPGAGELGHVAGAAAPSLPARQPRGAGAAAAGRWPVRWRPTTARPVSKHLRDTPFAKCRRDVHGIWCRLDRFVIALAEPSARRVRCDRPTATSGEHAAG